VIPIVLHQWPVNVLDSEKKKEGCVYILGWVFTAICRASISGPASNKQHPEKVVSSCDIFKCEFAGGVELHTWGAMFIGYRAVILQSFLRQVNINTLFGARVFPTVASKSGFQKVGVWGR
jgi:hypothetical protein